jgi:hypothetical protein
LRRQLGHAALVGGAELVEHKAYSDETMARLMRMDAAARKKAMASARRIADEARKNPRKRRQPSRDERTKIDWTSAFTERFLYEAPRSSDDLDLCRRLGLPAFCRGAMRAARSRHGILRASATVNSAKPERASPIVPLPLAA